MADVIRRSELSERLLSSGKYYYQYCCSFLKFGSPIRTRVKATLSCSSCLHQRIILLLLKIDISIENTRAVKSTRYLPCAKNREDFVWRKNLLLPIVRSLMDGIRWKQSLLVKIIGNWLQTLALFIVSFILLDHASVSSQKPKSVRSH